MRFKIASTFATAATVHVLLTSTRTSGVAMATKTRDSATNHDSDRFAIDSLPMTHIGGQTSDALDTAVSKISPYYMHPIIPYLKLACCILHRPTVGYNNFRI